jgi:hypothetical protein
MRRLLAALRATIGNGYDIFMITRMRFLVTVAFLYLVIMFEWAMKFWGYTLVDVVITTVLMFALGSAVSDPRIVALAETFEAARALKKEKKPRSPDYNFLPLYAAYTYQWLCIISMFVTTLPFGWYLSFGESFTYTNIGLLGISVIAWAAFFKWTTKVYYKKIILSWAVCVVLYCTWMVAVPLSVKYAVAPWLEFYGAMGTSETAKETARARWASSKAADEARAEKIKAIGKKLAQNEGDIDKLEKEERALWVSNLEKMNKESLQETVRHASSQIDLSQLDLSSTEGFGNSNSGSSLENFRKKMNE